MKGCLAFLAFAALVALSTACFPVGPPVCGRLRNTNTCRRFMNMCRFNLVGKGNYDQIDLSNCPNGVGINGNCANTQNNCGRDCAPLATSLYCSYLVGAVPDTCRAFRNQCEFNNFNCRNPNTYAQAASSRCAGLATNVEAPCV